MKTTTLVLAALLLGSAAVALAPGASALYCVSATDPAHTVDCQLDNVWVSCGGGYATLRYALEHPDQC